MSQEVKKLAEQTKNSIADIQNLVSSSQTYTDEVMTMLKQIEETVHSGTEASKTTSETFRTIQLSIEQNEKNLKDMDLRMNELVEVIEEIGQATTFVATSAESLSKATQEV